MPTYRCPICGATHKKQVSQCRLCGADMTGRPIPAETVLSSAPPVTVKGGIKGIVLIGLGIVLLLVVGAVLFGVVRSNETVNAVKNKVVSHEDGWTVQPEPDPSLPSDTPTSGSFTIELPGERTHETVDFVGTNDGTLIVWTAKIGKDTILQAGSGVITPPPPGAGPGPGGTATDQIPTGQNFLSEKADQWAAKAGITNKNYTVTNTVISGSAAVVLQTTAPMTKVAGQDAYVKMAFILNGNKMYVLKVVSIYKDADQLTKMINNFSINPT